MVRGLVEECLIMFTSQAKEKGLNLSSYIEPQVPDIIVGDYTRLSQILVNLLNNAIKFTEKGEVSISVKLVEKETEKNSTEITSLPSPITLQFEVKDTGIGIPDDCLHRLFKPFSQVDSSTTRKYGGTGLGLAIAKKLCQSMGGEMWLESQPDQGSTFYFTIVTKE